MLSVDSNWSDSPKTLNSAQNQRYLSFVTLKFHGWPWKIKGHLIYATSKYEHHFIAICELALELQSEKSQFWVKINIFLALWPWNFMDNLEKKEGTSSMLLQSLCIWNVLCYYYYYASVHSHLWSQTGDTVRKAQFGSKSTILLAMWPWKLTDDLENQ